jgi:hypothetical protein
MKRWVKPSKRNLPPKQFNNVTEGGVVCPDGKQVIVHWELLKPGMSVFIPAVNLSKLKKQVKGIAKKNEFVIKGAERIEGGLLGMRFWRLS